MDQAAPIAEWLVGAAAWATTHLQPGIDDVVSLYVAVSHAVRGETLRGLTSDPYACHEISASVTAGQIRVCVVESGQHCLYEVVNVRPVVPGVMVVTLSRSVLDTERIDSLRDGVFAGLVWSRPDGLATRWDRAWRQYRCRVMGPYTHHSDALPQILAGGFKAIKIPIVEAESIPIKHQPFGSVVMSAATSFAAVDSHSVMQGWSVDGCCVYKTKDGSYHCISLGSRNDQGLEGTFAALFAHKSDRQDVMLVGVLLGGSVDWQVASFDNPFAARLVAPTGCVCCIEDGSVVSYFCRPGIVVDVDRHMSCSLYSGELVPPSMQPRSCNFDADFSRPIRAILERGGLIARVSDAEPHDLDTLMSMHPVGSGQGSACMLPSVGIEVSKLLPFVFAGEPVQSTIMIGSCFWRELCCALDNSWNVVHLCPPSRINDSLHLHRAVRRLEYHYVDPSEVDDVNVQLSRVADLRRSKVVIDFTTRQADVIMRNCGHLLSQLMGIVLSIKVICPRSIPAAKSAGNFVVEKGLRSDLSVALKGNMSGIYRSVTSAGQFRIGWIDKYGHLMGLCRVLEENEAVCIYTNLPPQPGEG